MTFNKNKNPSKRALFLGYDATKTSLIDLLSDNDCSVEYSADKRLPKGKYDFVISFGYRHILTQRTIDDLACPIFNLHISYLPYNRGAHPNFWSFYDNTPSGVTIHLIDSGIDTGKIVRQRPVKFNIENETFHSTYLSLLSHIENLFLEFLPSLLASKWQAREQKGFGTHHYRRDLPLNFSGWHANIKEEIARLHREGLKYDCKLQD